MLSSTHLTEEEYWDRAQMLMTLAGYDTAMPDDSYARCDRCEHVGWRWHLGALRLCMGCRASRLRAARPQSRSIPKVQQDQGSEKPPKAMAPLSLDDPSSAFDVDRNGDVGQAG